MEMEAFSLCYYNRQDKVNSNYKYKRNNEVIEIWSRMCLNFQELGCARISPIFMKNTNYLFVDQAAGSNSGLVNGDFLKFEFISKKKEKIVNLDVCLRGFRGMHVTELSSKRAKGKSWKFCFYQAITAILTKTQLRYKYAWSGNVDYIYDHAWMLFIHTGLINVKRRQILNDIVVYNYKYNIELKLVDELKDICRITDSTCNNVEKSIKKKKRLHRNELMHIQGTLGLKKNSNLSKLLIDNTTKIIEEWFDKVDLSHMNSIIKTDIFCLSFWRDGLFWYLYNPFRCNEYGLWDDYGYNCIMKFCSRDSLKRHLTILLLKSITSRSDLEIENDNDFNQGNEDDKEYDVSQIKESTSVERNKKYLKSENNIFTIQIFKINLHCCKVYNSKSFQNVAFKTQIPERKMNHECNIKFKDLCMDEQVDLSNKVPWLQFSKLNQDESKNNTSNNKFMWYQYVEQKGKLFSLQVHISDKIFPKKIQGEQFYASCVICAGMAKLIAPEYWTSQTLNAIFIFGNVYFTCCILQAKQKFQTVELLNTGSFTNYLCEEFKIGNFLFKLKAFPSMPVQIYNKCSTSLKSSIEKCFLKYHFGILTCENACLGLFKHCDSYYVFDVCSTDSSIFVYEKGTAFLLRATDFHKFITSLLLIIGSSSNYKKFALNPIKILTIFDLDNIGCSKIYN
ncbi:uncharacterized protein LOC127290379 isoform X2 [Leptopilina boulardi]|uniref:uncharacterized protein LOC127290379 isoform X2 n=1 Tax=Leptopilina boulardi TaxID=63433 RepID=UPI0021F535BF|nr:uncharacterized protein LOC127290379 isoform X2 [Leptopilina boulardi]